MDHGDAVCADKWQRPHRSIAPTAASIGAKCGTATMFLNEMVVVAIKPRRRDHPGHVLGTNGPSPHRGVSAEGRGEGTMVARLVEREKARERPSGMALCMEVVLQDSFRTCRSSRPRLHGSHQPCLQHRRHLHLLPKLPRRVRK